MNCPNCGLANPDNAKFCSNCGTAFGSAASQPFRGQQSQSQYQAAPPYPAPGYPAPGANPNRNTLAKNVGIGCLIALALFLFFGLSCTRACFGFRHRPYIHRRY